MADDPRLTAHLRAYLGAWPPRTEIDVIGTPARLAPSWDGSEYWRWWSPAPWER